MIKFKAFLTSLNEGVRTGLPHITTMDTDQFHHLSRTGKIHIHDVTEKSDGMPHEFGHDEHGFYTRSKASGEAKVRTPEEYHHIAKEKAKKTGNPYNKDKADSFAHIHRSLQNNKALTNHLANEHKKTGKDVRVKGEIFYKPISKPSEHKGERRFILTSYGTHHMGSVGKYVIHSKLPENQHHDIEHFKKHLSNKEINFDDDKVHHTPSHVDVSKEHHDFSHLNHELINSRTSPKNKEHKMAEVAEFDAIKKRVSDKVDNHMAAKKLKNKWGSESEGHIVHPSHVHPAAPRFKVTSQEFRKNREAQKGKQLSFTRDTNA